jgi:hypothetical protein
MGVFVVSKASEARRQDGPVVSRWRRCRRTAHANDAAVDDHVRVVRVKFTRGW